MSDLLGRKGPLRGSQVSRRRARASPQGPERAQARGTAPQHGSEGARALCREQGRGGLTQPPARPVEVRGGRSLAQRSRALEGAGRGVKSDGSTAFPG